MRNGLKTVAARWRTWIASLAVLAGVAAAAPACVIVIDSGAIVVDNQSGAQVTAVFITTAGAPSWGANELFGSFIADGSSRRFSTFAPGFYDVRIEDEWGGVVEVLDLEVLSDADTVVLYDLGATNPRGYLEITNGIDWGTEETLITELYVTPSTAPQWGSNLLDGLAAAGLNALIEVGQLDEGTYDILAVDQFGAEYQRTGIAVSAGGTTSITLDASDAVATVGTIAVLHQIDWGDVGTFISEVYVSDSASADSGLNLLSGTVEFGQEILVEDLEQGQYDVQLVDTEGQTYAKLMNDVVAGQTLQLTFTTSDWEETVGFAMATPMCRPPMAKTAMLRQVQTAAATLGAAL